MSFVNKIEGAEVPQQHPYTSSPHSSSNQLNQHNLNQNNHISEPLSTSTTASTSKDSPIDHQTRKVTLDDSHPARDEFKGPSRRGTRDSAASGGGFERPPLMKRLTSLMKSERHIKREPTYKVRRPFLGCWELPCRLASGHYFSGCKDKLGDVLELNKSQEVLSSALSL